MFLIISILIVFAYAVNALMDGINFSKCPRKLNILWHLAKYVYVADVLLTGIMLASFVMAGEQSIFLLVIPVAIGIAIWQITYRIYRGINWPDWA